MKTSQKQIKEQYWTCNECAEKAGGKFPKDHVCTACLGDCPICHTKNVTLIPWVDFNWPDIRTAHMRD